MPFEKGFLQDGLFTSIGEKQLAALQIVYSTKNDKKRFEYYLTITIKNNPPFNPTLSIIRVDEKLKLKRIVQNLLETLSHCDAKFNTENNEFKCIFSDGLIVTYQSFSIVNKKDFIDILWETCQRYLIKRPIFKNYKHQLHKQTINNETIEILDKIEKQDEKKNIIQDEKLILEILTKFSNQVDNIDDFAESLNETLDDIKWGNLETIMVSQHYCKDVIEKLDNCLVSLDNYEKLLDKYDISLLDLRNQIKELEMIDSDRELRVQNQKLLLDSISKIITSLDIPQEIIDYVDLNDYNKDISKTVLALDSFLNIFKINIPDVLKNIPEIKNQYNKVYDCANIFIQNLTNNIIQIIKHYVSQPENSIIPNNDIVMTNHFKIHQLLKPYTPIVKSIKYMHASQFTELYTYYCTSFHSLYEKQIDGLIGVVLHKINTISNIHLLSQNLLTNKQKDMIIFIKLNETHFNSINDFKCYFDQYFEILELALTKEIKFCSLFFSLNVKNDENSNDIKTKHSLIIMKAMLQQQFGFLDDMVKKFLNIILKTYPMFYIYIINKLYLLIKRLTNPDFSFLLNLYNDWFNKIFEQFQDIFNNIFTSFDDIRYIKTKKFNACIPIVTFFEDFIIDSEYLLPDNIDNRCPQIETIYKKYHKRLINTIENINIENENLLKILAIKIGILNVKNI